MLYKITALTLQKKNRQRINVFLDGEFAFGLDRLVAGWLHTGQEISDERISELKTADAREVAFQSALHLLKFRPRTESEVRSRLLKKSVSPDDVEEVIDRLKRNQMLDDRRFTIEWIENRSELKPRSRRALEYELRIHGVEQEIIQDSLAEVDDEQLAYQAAARQVRKYQDLEWSEFRIKLARYLNQRGFQYDTIRDITNRIWNEMHETNYTPQT
jgi:regulatory protein